MSILRFLVFPSGIQFTSDVLPSSSVLQVKQSIALQWPSALDPLENVAQLRLIYSGHELQDTQILSDVLQLDNSNEKPANESNIHTVHVVVRKSVSDQGINNNNNIVHNNVESEANTEKDTELDVPMDWHIHGCTFNEEEAEQLNVVFQKKKGEDNKMPWKEICKVLNDYWKWSAIHKFHDANLKFPTQEMAHIKEKVLPDEDRATQEQFLSIFFLFDNHTPESTCPHGHKSRVLRATEELHKALMGTDHAFDISTFECVFQRIDQDSDGILNCKEVELFFYIYSVNVCANNSAIEATDSAAKANANATSTSTGI